MKFKCTRFQIILHLLCHLQNFFYKPLCMHKCWQLAYEFSMFSCSQVSLEKAILILFSGFSWKSYLNLNKTSWMNKYHKLVKITNNPYTFLCCNTRKYAFTINPRACRKMFICGSLEKQLKRFCQKSWFLSCIPIPDPLWDVNRLFLQSQSTRFGRVGNETQKSTFLTNRTFNNCYI